MTTPQQEKLFEAVGQGNITKVQELFNQGHLDANFIINGTTPVHLAAQIANAGVLEVLIRHGADTHALDAYGIDAIDATEGYIESQQLIHQQYESVFALLMGGELYPAAAHHAFAVSC